MGIDEAVTDRILLATGFKTEAKASKKMLSWDQEPIRGITWLLSALLAQGNIERVCDVMLGLIKTVFFDSEKDPANLVTKKDIESLEETRWDLRFLEAKRVKVAMSTFTTGDAYEVVQLYEERGYVQEFNTDYLDTVTMKLWKKFSIMLCGIMPKSKWVLYQIAQFAKTPEQQKAEADYAAISASVVSGMKPIRAEETPG